MTSGLNPSTLPTKNRQNCSAGVQPRDLRRLKSSQFHHEVLRTLLFHLDPVLAALRDRESQSTAAPAPSVEGWLPVDPGSARETHARLTGSKVRTAEVEAVDPRIPLEIGRRRSMCDAPKSAMCDVCRRPPAVIQHLERCSFNEVRMKTVSGVLEEEAFRFDGCG